MTTQPVQSALSGNNYVNALLWGGYHWQDPSQPGTTTVINYYLDVAGNVPWQAAEQAAIARAFSAWSSVADISFVRVLDSSQAQLVERLVPEQKLPGTLGEHGTPDGAISGNPPVFDGNLLLGANNQVFGYFNYQAFTPGSFGFGAYDLVTFIHELGHGLGLAHPHDTGGGSGLFPGVREDQSSDFGAHNLNQGIYTVLSYNDGWASFQDPVGHNLAQYGFESGPMAFDIAAIQHLYGANTTAHSGNDVYALPGGNHPGTAWSCIWDTGGTDQLVYNGALNVQIDLRAATLDNSPTGGGVVSYATGIYGGFTIANGVVIENAQSGNGNDSLVGNDVANVLMSGKGKDGLYGGGGDDSLWGGAGADKLFGGSGSDTFVFNTGLRAANIDKIGDFQHGIDHIYLNHNIFARAGHAGDLHTNVFALNSAKDSHDHIIYHPRDGTLSYDVNGKAAGGSHVFASVHHHTTLTAADFFIF